MEPKYRRCCGIDVHKKSVTVCVLPVIGKAEVTVLKRNFPTFTRDLKQLRKWLKNCKVTEIAMESTGQYWRAIWNVLEGHFEKLILVNPQHIKGLNGYKTDPKDAEWIAGLLEGGKLRGSWVPPREIRELRDLTRQRVHVLEDANRVKNRIEQLCQTGNIKISSVATDLFGVSGRKMLKAQQDFPRTAPGRMNGHASRGPVSAHLSSCDRRLRVVLDRLPADAFERNLNLGNNSPGWAFIRPISARYPAWLSLRTSARILVRRLERRSRQRLGGPSDRDRRNISIAC